MTRNFRRVAASAVAVLAAALTAVAGVRLADAATAVPACDIRNVSFFYGGNDQGVGNSEFDITLLARNTTGCSLPDAPLITLGSPPAQTTPVPLTVQSTPGGTLVLTPDTPLHAVVEYRSIDDGSGTLQVNSLTLALPDGSSRAAGFGTASFAPTSVAQDAGVFVSAWTTGIGLGAGEFAFG